MALIERLTLQDSAAAPFEWAAVVARAQTWGQARSLSMRDAVVLVPCAQHLPLVRRAWAHAGGWLARIETPQTLANALCPASTARSGQISFDTANDRLTAAQLLSAQGWAKHWAHDHAHGFSQVLGQLVEASHAIARTASKLPPQSRAAYWHRCRSVLANGGGPASLERSLALIAIEWAALSEPPASDVLFSFQPCAWIAVQAGGLDDLTLNLLTAASDETPCAVIDTDPPPAEPFGAQMARNRTGNIHVAVCSDLEDEAQCTAAQVLVHLSQGQQPVALIVQDRLLMRRVRALLERQQVLLQDETGWKCSTTRAGAQVMNLLRAAEAQASTDTVLDWLKAAPAGAGEPTVELESQLRRKDLTRALSVDAAQLGGAGASAWLVARKTLHTFATGPRKLLADWLTALETALRRNGDWEPLLLDDAGQQILTALGLGQSPVAGSAWEANRRTTVMTLADFTAWVDTVLEQASFLPMLDDEDTVRTQVVITPLVHALLRPFAAVVFPGVDAKRLGSPAKPPALLGESLSVALGLASSSARLESQTLAFVQMLRAPHVTLLRRQSDGADPLAASPLLERLTLAAQRARAPIAPWVDPRIAISVVSQPVYRPAPQAVPLLPARLSASACEALRACPYRFFALYVLRLSEVDELDDKLEKRDYGTWLHKVLLEFHRARVLPATAAQEVATLRACGAEQQAAMGLDDSDFLPFSASFARFAPRYIEWLHRRDAQGAQWLRGEHDVVARPAQLRGVELYGRIDRIDRLPNNITQLIDYKTASAQNLRDKLKQPLEDTQLAFYAALMTAQTPVELQATYLALDDAKGIQKLEHPQVAESARQLIAGLANEHARMRAGAGLPALGERRLCDHCEARGLCRRDHWEPA